MLGYWFSFGGPRTVIVVLGTYHFVFYSRSLEKQASGFVRSNEVPQDDSCYRPISIVASAIASLARSPVDVASPVVGPNFAFRGTDPV